MNDKKKRFHVPHTFVILLIMAIIALILTYFIPAGQYDRVVDEATGRTVIDADSFQYIESTPVSPIKLPEAIYNALVQSAGTIAFIFMIGGAFEIIMQTGALSKYIGKLTDTFKDKNRNVLILIIMIAFSIGGFTFGMSIEGIVFVQMFIALMTSLGYDAIVGTSIVLTGMSCGFIAGIMNPFNVGVAQEIVGLPLYSGAWMRIILWVVLLAVSFWYLTRYAKKVYNNPEKSIVADLHTWDDMAVDDNIDTKLTTRDILIGITIVACLASIPYGVIKYDWGMGPMAGVFLMMGVISGLIYGFGPSKIAEIFIVGAKNITGGALIVGVARTISVLLTDGNIIDTIIYGLSVPLGQLPHSIQAVGMYVAHTLINVPITSGTGQAAATMPIMGPLAEVIGISKQTAVLTFQMGDGITNNILPTSSALMGMLSVARLPYEKWLKYGLPLIGIWFVIGIVFCFIATAVGY